MGFADRHTVDRAIPLPSKVLILAVIAVLVFLRRPDAFTNPQFWAEDGNLFFLDAWRDGFRSMFQPYRGLHLVLVRLIALAGRAVPIAWVPAWYALASLAAVLSTAAYCLSDRIPISASARIMLALLVVATPTGNEVFMTPTNAQWILAPMLLLLAVSRPPASWAQRLFDTALVTMVGLTGAFIALFSPLFILRLVFRRSAHDAALATLAIICSAIQLVHLDPSRADGPVAAYHDLGFFRVLANVICGAFAGMTCTTNRIESTLLSVLLFALYAVLGFDAWRRRSFISAAVLAGGFVVVCSALYAFRANPQSMVGGQRYLYIPCLTLLWALVLQPWRPGKLAVGIGFAAFVSFVYHSPPLVDYRWRESSRCIGTAHPCRVPINPPGWFIEIP
jgi:hypothetical protein